MIFELSLDHFESSRSLPSAKVVNPKKAQPQFKAISAIRMPMALAMQTLHIDDKLQRSTDSVTSSRNGSICSESAAYDLRRHSSAPQLDKTAVGTKKASALHKAGKSGSFDTVSLPKTLLGRFKHLTVS